MLQELQRQHEAHKAVRERLIGPRRVQIIEIKQPVIESIPLSANKVEFLEQENAGLRRELALVRADLYRLQCRYERPSEYHKPIMIAAIKRACAEEFGVPVMEIESESRRGKVVRARHAVAWLARRLSKKSTTEIGRMLGGRDHTTILSSSSRADQLMENDRDFAENVVTVRERLIAEANGGDNVDA